MSRRSSGAHSQETHIVPSKNTKSTPSFRPRGRWSCQICNDQPALNLVERHSYHWDWKEQDNDIADEVGYCKGEEQLKRVHTLGYQADCGRPPR